MAGRSLSGCIAYTRYTSRPLRRLLSRRIVDYKNGCTGVPSMGWCCSPTTGCRQPSSTSNDWCSSRLGSYWWLSSDNRCFSGSCSRDCSRGPSRPVRSLADGNVRGPKNTQKPSHNFCFVIYMGIIAIVFDDIPESANQRGMLTLQSRPPFDRL